MTLDDVTAAAEDYVLGVADQDPARLAALFAETATITGIDEGVLISVPRDRWIGAVCAPERAGAGARDYGIGAVLIEESVAAVVVHTTYGRFRYRDVLALLAGPDGLRVTGKTFHQLPHA